MEVLDDFLEELVCVDVGRVELVGVEIEVKLEGGEVWEKVNVVEILEWREERDLG